MDRASIRREAHLLRTTVLEFLQRHPTLKVGEFAKWMEEEKGQVVNKQSVYSALYALVECKQLKRKEAGSYQLAGNTSRSRSHAARARTVRITPEEHVGQSDEQ
jgi:Fe2+ or Zn2+ uptake regulation protein